MVDKTKRDIISSGVDIKGDVYIGGGETDAMEYVADVIKEIRTTHPNITFHLYSGNAEDVMEKLDKKLLDFGLLVQHNDTSKYDSVTLPVADVWGVLMRKNDPLAEKDHFEVSDLSGLPLICSRQWVDQESPRWLGSAAKEMNIVATYNLVYNGSIMVRAGMGYAVVLDKLVNTSDESDLIFKPLSEAPQSDIYVIWRKYQTFTPIAELLLQELRSRLR